MEEGEGATHGTLEWALPMLKTVSIYLSTMSPHKFPHRGPLLKRSYIDAKLFCNSATFTRTDLFFSVHPIPTHRQ